MRVLWLCSIPQPEMSQKYNLRKYNIGSWIEGMKNYILKEKSIELGYMFPLNEENPIHDSINNVKVYSFNKENFDEKLVKKIFDDFKPDILHIFGTENEYAYKIAKIFNNPKKTIVNLQGIVTAIGRHYSSGLPDVIRYGYTIRDIVKKNNIQKEINKFEKSSINEKLLIEYAENFIGRTEFDQAIVKMFNSSANYYECNETLRAKFYENIATWKYDNCKKNTIFMSQAQYPVKGLHFALEAINILKNKYPDIKLYISGTTIKIIPNNLKEYFMQPMYSRYLWKYIKKNNLQDLIAFTGSLNENEMIEMYKKANVFISPSTIENESNSLSEAKIIGTPAVVSYVGGMTNRINHGVDGFIYQHNAPYMLAFYIDKLLANSNLCKSISYEASNKSKMMFSQEKNGKILINIYKKVDGR